MKIKLSQKEIEYLLFLINEAAEKNAEMESGMSASHEYSEEDLELIDKLETALKLLEIERFWLGEAAKNKPLN